MICCVPAYGNSQPYLVFSSSDSFSFFLYLSLRRAVTVPLYENAIPEIFYLQHLHLLLLRVYGMPTFLSTMFLSRACTKEDQSVRRPPRRLQVLCPLSFFSKHQCCSCSFSRTFQPTIYLVCTRLPTTSLSFFSLSNKGILSTLSSSFNNHKYAKFFLQ